LDYVRKKGSHNKKILQLNAIDAYQLCILIVLTQIYKEIKVTNSIEQKLDRVIELLEKDKRG
jgi:hypothetical protein